MTVFKRKNVNKYFLELNIQHDASPSNTLGKSEVKIKIEEIEENSVENEDPNRN